MRVDSEKAAREWLAAWEGRPRRGILKAAIDGLELCLAIDVEYGHRLAAADCRAALAVLRQNYRDRLEENALTGSATTGTL